jgi:cell division septation protein DedD
MENRLKERLTGAAILVALIVMVVPELFHGQRGDVATSAASSSGDGPPRRSYTIDLTGSAGGSAPLQSAPAAANDDQPPAAAPSEPPPTAGNAAPASQASDAPAAVTSPPAPEPPPAPAARASASKAAAAQPSPQPQSKAEKLPLASGNRTPAASERGGAGEHSAASERGGAGEHNVGAGGWIVQLGLFAKRDNADRLMHAAQAKGFAVTVASPDAHGLYRVYAGGMADRAAAEAVAQRLKTQAFPAAVITAP